MAENPEEKLIKADSLFEESKYTQALDIYEGLLYEDQSYTPRMLMKVAYIYEGLGDYTKSLYFLNMYYHHTADQAVLVKMEDMAGKYELEGYKFTDYDFFRSIFNKYYEIIFGVSILLLLSFFFGIAKRKRNGRTILPHSIAYLTLLGTCVWLFNYGFKTPKAIVNANNSLLMKSASAGSDIYKSASKGTRMDIVGKQDIWYKVKVDQENDAFIRQSNLMVIE
ncbi:tetratricopeptide repeat protein [Sediminitomix flava]|uniref:SH3 domain-containing protein n=1 Tax=Sediminitomix flava TaxID=379075 RepID=A0A315ZGY6_SEDFL|nr:hypothetical protein [Sediminitomix flava]PWJ44846.1 hypothetical protein BC781_1011225 [Sediminitomix flava]